MSLIIVGGQLRLFGRRDASVNTDVDNDPTAVHSQLGKKRRLEVDVSSSRREKREAAKAEARAIARVIREEQKNFRRYMMRTDFPLITTLMHPTDGGSQTRLSQLRAGRAFWWFWTPFQSSVKDHARRIVNQQNYAATNATIENAFDDDSDRRYLIRMCHSAYRIRNKMVNPLCVTLYRVRFRTRSLFPPAADQESAFWRLIAPYNYLSTGTVPVNQMLFYPIALQMLAEGWRNKVTGPTEAVTIDAASTCAQMNSVNPMLSPYDSNEFCKAFEIMSVKQVILDPEAEFAVKCVSNPNRKWEYAELINQTNATGGGAPTTASTVNQSVFYAAETEMWLFKFTGSDVRRAQPDFVRHGDYAPFAVPPRYDQNDAFLGNVRTTMESNSVTSFAHVKEDILAEYGWTDTDVAAEADEITIHDNRVADSATVAATHEGDAPPQRVYLSGPVPMHSDSGRPDPNVLVTANG